MKKKKKIEEEVERLKTTNIKPTEELNNFLLKYGTNTVNYGIKLSELLKRTELDYEKLSEIDKDRPNLAENVWKEAEIMIKYYYLKILIIMR